MTANNYSFDSNFEVLLADTPESKALHYNVRYQVYCEEMGFEDKERFPDQLELDQWDSHSVHFLVRDKRSGYWVGALRLVLPDRLSFPLEHHCVLEKKISPSEYRQSVELSRLCVLKEVRRFSARRFAPYGLLEQENPIFDSSKVTALHNNKNLGLTVMWGLLRAALTYCIHSHISDLYLLVAPALACAIRKEGFSPIQVGDPCLHRGKRLPFRWEIDDIAANPLWEKDYKIAYGLYSDCFENDIPYRKFA